MQLGACENSGRYDNLDYDNDNDGFRVKSDGAGFGGLRYRLSTLRP